MLIAGCDLGKSSASFVLVRLDDNGGLVVEESAYGLHEGNPFALFRQWYEEKEVSRCAILGATGAFAEEFLPPVLVLPEDACQEAALDRDGTLPDSLNLVSVGARGYSILTRSPFPGDERGAGSTRERYGYQFLENDKCSSGTGENIGRIAGRFGLTIEEADALALSAEEAIPITARCSVFAKSEMTHFANQGQPAKALFRGYFRSVARNVGALLNRNRVDGPIYMIGGCSRIGAFREALEELLEQKIHLPEESLCFEALGAAILAAGQAGHPAAGKAGHPAAGQAGHPAAGQTIGEVPSLLPRDPSEIIRKSGKRFRVLDAAGRWKNKVRRLKSEAVPRDWLSKPVVLGLDLGSTGAKAVLTLAESGRPVMDIYDRTRGNPVDAARRLVGRLLEEGTPQVKAIGVTGSGREAVATLLRALFPESEGLFVINEIVAHAKAAVHADPDRGRDLSVIEIGGQDAKYIRVSGGRIVESDMNKVCSAGTGSFLEEQAAFYDVTDIEEVSRMARRAERPPDLGQLCTVYVADAAQEALKEGFSLGDLFAGFQYSIIQNYLNRVMGQRKLGARIFFQGKPATNPALAWTLAAVTGREIVVPASPGAMGAWGIGLHAVEQLGARRIGGGPVHDLRAVLEAEIISRSTFQCLDKRCSTLCPIERTEIKVGPDRRFALSGGACPKYEVQGARGKLERDAPDPFAHRQERLWGFSQAIARRPLIAIPQTGPVGGYIPWLATFIKELGFSVEVLRSRSGSLAAGEQLCNSFDSCGPSKIAHAICDTSIPYLLFPKILHIGDREGPGGQSCVTEQAMPDIVEQSLAARKSPVKVLKPTISFNGGEDGDHARGVKLLAALRAAGVELSLDLNLLNHAVVKAASAQREFEAALKRDGEEALAYARARHLPAVLVCGPLHVIHDNEINAQIPLLLRRNGAMAIPMDSFAIEDHTPPMKLLYWGDQNRLGRAAAHARARGDIFPLMLSSFGCGPSSFVEHAFQLLLDGYPHTILESDGHGGEAGFVTRIQAFLESVRQHLAEEVSAAELAPSAELAAQSPGLDFLDTPPSTGAYLSRDVRYVFLSGPEYFGELLAAVYRSQGYDAVAAPPLSKTNLACGQQDCSGKECLSYQMVWGAFREYLEKNPPDKETRLMQITGQMCRGGLFPFKDRLSVERMGLTDQVPVFPIRQAGGAGTLWKLWLYLAVQDILRQLYLYHMAVESRPGEARRLYDGYCERLLEIAARPAERGLKAGFRLGQAGFGATRLLWEAAREYARMDAAHGGREALPVIFLTGDLLTKGSDFASGGFMQVLGEQGIRIIFEPACEFLEFLARVHPHLYFGKRSSPLRNAILLANMVAVRQGLYGAMRRRHSWLPVPAMEKVLKRASRIISPDTNGGAVLHVGSALYHWENYPLDGIVVTSCWGCDNGLIAESLLRHRRDIPSLFFYDDGTPIDQRRIQGFAFRLKRRPRQLMQSGQGSMTTCSEAQPAEAAEKF